MITRQLQVERRTGKVRQPETDVLPLSHAANQYYNDDLFYLAAISGFTHTVNAHMQKLDYKQQEMFSDTSQQQHYSASIVAAVLHQSKQYGMKVFLNSSVITVSG